MSEETKNKDVNLTINTESDEARPVGRPSKYKDEYAQKLLDYFADYTKVKVDETGEPLSGQKLKPFPTLAGFAIKIGVAKDTLNEWSNAKDEEGSLKYQEFSVAYERAKDFQENYLVVNGLEGNLHPQFAMFVAKNVIGWRDKQKDEVDTVINNNNSQNNVNLSEDDLNKKIEEKMKALEKK